MALVDEIGFERKPCKLGAPDADVSLRLPLKLSNSLDIEIALDSCVACRCDCQRS